MASTSYGDDIRFLKGIGEQRAKLFQKLGISTLGELLSFFPRAYEDRRSIKKIAGLSDGENCGVAATAASTVVLERRRPGFSISRLIAADDSGKLDIVFFNQPYVRDQIKAGQRYFFFGKVSVYGRRKTLQNPSFEPIGEEETPEGRILPIYRLCAGLKNNFVRSAVKNALEATGDAIPEPLPESFRQKWALAHARFAYENIHFPASDETLSIAMRRLVFEELLTLTLGLFMLKGRRQGKPGAVLPPADMSPFYKSLPYAPTGAQARAIADCMRDMSSGRAMNRLLQGDVGSGKTLVAAALVYFAVSDGRQAALMAPTEVLAEQHYRDLAPLFSRLGIKTALLTGGLSAREKKEVYAGLLSGETGLVIGTHAVIQEKAEFAALSLVICDEQHRFGVRQRAELSSKGENPHILVMSATPIPRTLALIMYGDLEVSILDEMPPGRRGVDTFAVGEDKRERIEEFIKKQVREGRQAYIVCPLVDENDASELKSVTAYTADLQSRVFRDFRVAFMHGRLRPREKEEVMRSFSAGDIDILVSTTVIEVGVNVPNATVMVVENAERFGLSQLHQLRGRVGRGEHKSYCILFSEGGGELTRSRLETMCKTNDGFKIAQKDLELRGPGDFFGERQHGLPELHIASLSADLRVLDEASGAARGLLEADPGLSSPENAALYAHVRSLFSRPGGGDIFN